MTSRPPPHKPNKLLTLGAVPLGSSETRFRDQAAPKRSWSSLVRPKTDLDGVGFRVFGMISNSHLVALKYDGFSGPVEVSVNFSLLCANSSDAQHRKKHNYIDTAMVHNPQLPESSYGRGERVFELLYLTKEPL